MPKINYTKATSGDYDWHVVTSEGVVISGTVVKRTGRWESGWVATVTYVDGERYVTPEGGRLTGHADSRKAAVERALHRYTIGASGRWLEVMNT